MLLQYIVVFIILDYVNGDNTKSSLTFVIDNSLSMYDDIEQVKEHTNQVFDAVLNSNASKIDDFIIVTFNDPGAQLYTVTRNRDVFKKALAEITVRGNYDCPEYAMKGIELALENSKPNSFLYVFTDAAAKDYKEYDRIKSLGLKKSIQVTFLLTGECLDSPWEANAVYDKLAAATNGQVFHLEKQEIKKIMGYIFASVKHIKTTLAHKYFDTALNKKFQFSIDSKVWDVIISVSGLSPRYHLTGPDGNKVEMKTFIDTEKSHISTLEAKPGMYTIHLDSKGAISTVITGSTAFSLQHSFATVQPNTFNKTSTRPISGLPSYLSIALDNIDKDVSLDSIEIRDIDDNLISEFPLTLIDKNQQFYVTKPLLTPDSTFKLAINGHTATKEKITRVASTAIEPQKPELEGPIPKAPTVTISEGAHITGEYDKIPIKMAVPYRNLEVTVGDSVNLACLAEGYPKPKVQWTFYSKNPRIHRKLLRADSTGSISVKHIQVEDEGIYSCSASNVEGLKINIYEIQLRECFLDIEKDFNEHQPLLLSRSQQWPDFKKLNNFLRIPKSTPFLLSCPGNTVTYNEEEFGEYVEAICIDNLILKIRDRNVDFYKIKCKEEIKSLVKNTNQSCFSGNTELLKVGFMLQRNILEVYDICLDKDNKIPLFTRHNLRQGISGTLPKKNFKFTGSQYLFFKFEDTYTCWYQLYIMQLIAGRNLNKAYKCCFKKRQLVSSADVIPGLSQVATYNYLNVIPQTCGTENWDEIERRIRSLAMFSDINLSVFTGSSYPLTLPGQSSRGGYSDSIKKLQLVPTYIWKVVQNTRDKSSLAIVQLNIPNITLSEALSYMPCEDICDEVEWMKNYYWHDVDKGFTFCCSITEFDSYYGMHIKGYDKVFKTIPVGLSVSDHSLI